MKKGAYDLGRKAIYYVIVVLVLGFLLLYTDNVFGRVQEDTVLNIGSIKDMIKLSGAMNCISLKEDTRIYLGVLDENQVSKFQECMKDPNVILLLESSPEFAKVSVEGYNTYTKAVLHNDKFEIIKLRIKQ